MARLWTNSIRGELSSGVAAGDTTLDAAIFAELPAVSSPDTLRLTLDPGREEGLGKPEIVEVTAHSASSTSVTVTRAVETGNNGGSAQAWPSGTTVVHALTSGDADNFVTETFANATYQRLHMEDVTDHGATGDGSTDDTTAIQSAVDVGGRIHFPGGTYRVTSTLTVSSDTRLEFAPGALVDGSELAASDPLFKAEGGGLGTSSSLSADASTGDSSVSVNDASIFSADDLVMLRGEERWRTDASATKQGEFHFVESVDTVANTVTLKGTVWDPGGYTTGNSAQLSNVSMLNRISIYGGTFRGGGSGNDQNATAFDFVKDLRVVDATFEDWENRALEVSSVVYGYVDRCRFTRNTNTSLAYGIAIRNGCHWLEITGNHFEDMRHAITSGGPSSAYGISRFVTIQGNTVYHTVAGAFDQHPSSQYWVYTGNTITDPGNDGFIMTSIDTVITGNLVMDAGRSGIRFDNASIHDGYTTITGNTFIRPGSIAIDFNPSDNGGGYNRVTISGNQVLEGGDHGIRFNNNGTSTTTMEKFVIVGNYVQAASDRQGIHIDAILNDIRNGSITGNVCEVAGSGEGIRIRQRDTHVAELFNVTGNRCFGGDYGIRGLGATDCWVDGNHASGSTAAIDGFDAADLGDNRTV